MESPYGDQYSLAIGSIAVNTSDGTVYVGTGEGNFNQDNYYGIGMLKSSDHGKTWRPVADTNSFGNSSITKIVIDNYTKPNRILASTGILVYITSKTGLAIDSSQPINTEFASPSSSLIGGKIDTITLKLRTTGLPTGTAQIGVFNTDLSVKKLFGTKDVATLTGSYADYSFTISSELYTISLGYRIGIKFVGGNATNNVAVMRDTDPADPFD
jgi:hypothetical protein